MRLILAYLLGALTAGVGGAAALSFAPEPAGELEHLRAENRRLRVDADAARRAAITRQPDVKAEDRIPPTAVPER